LLAAKIKSRVYVAGAIGDASFTDEMKARLDDALTKAGVDHTIEPTRPNMGGCFAGFVPRAAEIGWRQTTDYAASFEASTDVELSVAS
jgi:carboxymethylenebutenolidase